MIASDKRLEIPKLEYPIHRELPSQKVYSYLLSHFGLNYYIDGKKIKKDKIIFPISTKVIRKIKDFGKEKDRIITIKFNNLFEITYDIEKDEITAPNPQNIKDIRTSLIDQWFKRIEHVILTHYDYSKKFVRLVLIRSQLSPIETIIDGIWYRNKVSSSIFIRNKNQLDLLRETGFIVKRGNKITFSDRVNRKIYSENLNNDKLLTWIISELILNHADKLNKRKLYSYRKPFYLLRSYYEDDILYNKWDGDGEPLNTTIDDFIKSTKYKYNFMVRGRRDEYNLIKTIKQFIENEVFYRFKDEEQVFHGDVNIHEKLLKQDFSDLPIASLEGVA